MNDTKQHLEQKLWNIANTLRGKMGADDFRDYILGFIFYKYLSNKMHAYANQILKPDGLKYKEINEANSTGQEYLEAIRGEALESLGYFLRPSELFSELARRGNGDGKSKFILEDLTAVLNNIAQSTMGTDSEEDFDHLFEDLDLTSSKLGKTTDAKNDLIVKVLTHLNEIDFRLEDTEADVLGDAYEYLIGKFASGAGKKAGEFYTPQQVSMILAKIVTTGKERLKNVYDPTCGSGSLLLRVAKETIDPNTVQYFGQESNPTTYNLCRMNMIMHGVHYRKFDIRNEDTLEHPQHSDMKFEAVVANPPFSAKWSASPLFMSDDRFAAYGKLAPSSKADFAFVQHMVHQLDDTGTMACVLPHGVLFRGAAEGHIRKYLIEEKNHLDAVIGLPANIFYGTSIPTCILVLKKKRDTSDILFIDASQHFEKVKTQNMLLPKHIDKIVTTYRERTAEDKYSYIAPIAEVRENDFNLNIPRYVDTFEEEEPVDLSVVANELQELDKNMQEVDAEIADNCKHLGIKAPI